LSTASSTVSENDLVSEQENDPPFQQITVTFEHSESDGLESPPLEWGRRKEREWSGEWNVKDMKAVADKLRGLKAR